MTYGRPTEDGAGCVWRSQTEIPKGYTYEMSTSIGEDVEQSQPEQINTNL